MSNIDESIVKHVAKLARIEIASNEIEKYSQELSNILTYIDHIQQIELDSGVSNDAELSNVFREDEVTNTNIRDKLLANCPMTEDGLIKVKQVL